MDVVNMTWKHKAFDASCLSNTFAFDASEFDDAIYVIDAVCYVVFSGTRRKRTATLLLSWKGFARSILRP